jgi:hypothetical protein
MVTKNKMKREEREGTQTEEVDKESPK